MKDNAVTHPEPVWRDRANFIIAAQIPESTETGPEMEQLWARQIQDSLFEICCIPFFLYNVALGDKVLVKRNHDYVMKSVVEPSGRFVFRVWLTETGNREQVVERLTSLGCLIESRGPSSKLLAVDAESDETAKACANSLQELENSGELQYETGRL